MLLCSTTKYHMQHAARSHPLSSSHSVGLLAAAAADRARSTRGARRGRRVGLALHLRNRVNSSTHSLISHARSDDSGSARSSTQAESSVPLACCCMPLAFFWMNMLKKMMPPSMIIVPYCWKKVFSTGGMMRLPTYTVT